MKKKMLCLLLAATTCVNLCACGSTTEDAFVQESETVAVAEDSADASAQTEVSAEDAVNVMSTLTGDEEYNDASSVIFDAAMGDFYSMYETAKESDNVSEKFALMALAEAKLMEDATVTPTTAAGGFYGMSRVAPYTIDYCLWGNDGYRYHGAVVCNEIIKNTDIKAMKAKWTELKGTGEYKAWAKQYLVDNGYTIKDDYTIGYNADPVTWDEFATYLAADSDAIINCFDGLIEYDNEGEIQPALADSWEVSDDGLTYTFHLKKGVKWTDSQGRVVDEVKADDFVAAMQHLCDCQAGMEYLVDGVLVNAREYMYGEISDFSQVGVKAVDDYTLEYSLCSPCSYFMTMLGYTIFAPLCRSYYVSKGGKFGSEFDSSAADYTYGKDPNSIAYCGPYLVKNATEKNTIVFESNPEYYAPEKVDAKTITWKYNSGEDPTKSYTDFNAGILDSCTLNTSTLTLCKSDGLFDEYAYVGRTDACSYMNFMNLNRAAFANTNDETTVVSTETEEDALRTKYAMNDVHFRRALAFGLDRAAYNAQATGDELKLISLRNSYTPGTFVSLEEDVTVDINGTATTFAAGTYYGEIEQAQLDADNIPIKVWDPNGDDGVGSGDGFDGWYNVENAQAELETAIADLAAYDITIDESNPIYIDFPYVSTVETYANKANAFKKSVEESLGQKVIVNLVECQDYTEWYYAGYYTSYGYEANYDIYDLSGWIPDYGDPCSYLDTLLPDGDGYMTKCLGIF